MKKGSYLYKFSSRKWHLAILLMIVSSVLSFYGKLSGTEWEITVLFTYVCYLIGNITSASIGSVSIQGKAQDP